MTEPLVLNPSFTQNPHPVLQRLRTAAPVSRAIMWGGVPVWLITRYDDAKALLVDPRLSKDRAAALALFPPDYIGVYDSELTSGMLHTDPPDHTRLRKLVVKAFTAGAVERMRPRIENIADELLNEIDTTAPVDIISAYAGPLPVRVISELLGVPPSIRAAFRRYWRMHRSHDDLVVGARSGYPGAVRDVVTTRPPVRPAN